MNRFRPPDPADDDPPCCTECSADREDCGPDCEKMARFLREYEEDVRQAETDHPMHDHPMNEDRGIDEQWEREP